MGRGVRPVAENSTAVLAQMQMAVEPAICADVRRDVPPSSAKVVHEHSAAVERRPCGGRAADKDMLLMAVNDIGVPKLAKYCPAEVIGALLAHQLRFTNHTNSKLTNPLISVLGAK